MENIVAIDYEHTSDGAAYNGIAWRSAGRPEVNWNYDSGDELVTRSEAISEATFSELWRRISASLASHGVFWRAAVADPTRPTNPEAEHLIAVAIERQGRPQLLTFAVPADETDAEFTAWLRLLGVPTQGAMPLAA